MSLTAKRPRGANSLKGSTHMGLLGTSLTIAASPDLMNLGSVSVALPKFVFLLTIEIKWFSYWRNRSRSGVYFVLMSSDPKDETSFLNRPFGKTIGLTENFLCKIFVYKYLYACQPSPWFQQTCRQCGQCDSPRRENNHWKPVRGGSAR